MKDISTEQKIDYIYDRLQKQEKAEKFKFISRWAFRIVVILYIVYLYKIALPGFIEEIKQSLTPSINIEKSETLEKIQQYIDNTF